MENLPLDQKKTTLEQFLLFLMTFSKKNSIFLILCLDQKRNIIELWCNILFYIFDLLQRLQKSMLLHQWSSFSSSFCDLNIRLKKSFCFENEINKRKIYFSFFSFFFIWVRKGRSKNRTLMLQHAFFPMFLTCHRCCE